MVLVRSRFSLASSTVISATSRDETSGDRLAELFAPLEQLLCEGGDERLALQSDHRLNRYGCRPAPRPSAIIFSSSTATSISDWAYDRARRAQEALIEQASIKGLLEAFDSHVEHTRHSLRAHLGLDGSGAEVVFSPSGTDTQLHALFLDRLALGDPITSIVVGSDQTGSGTVHTAHAHHFASRTARGRAVLKGSAIPGWTDDIATVGIPFADPNGGLRSGPEMDRIVLAAVAGEISRGRRVVLQIMNASKFGWRAPSETCVSEIARCWPSDVQIVVDACQMRVSSTRIGPYLEQNFLVMLTGSKFLTGPPFCGVLLIPRRQSEGLASLRRLPRGLFDYADRSDLPQLWSGLRPDLAFQPNFGQWLRWEAAFEEMRCYYALPQSYRIEVLSGLAAAIPRAIESSGCLKYLAVPEGLDCNRAGDGEFASPTIFPFLVRDDAGYLKTDEATELYQALNRDVSNELPCHSPLCERTLAARPCHLGQPVALTLPDGGPAAALRIAIGARSLFESWSPGSEAASRSIKAVMADVSIAIRKIELLMKLRGQELKGADQNNAFTTVNRHG